MCGDLEMTLFYLLDGLRAGEARVSGVRSSAGGMANVWRCYSSTDEERDATGQGPRRFPLRESHPQFSVRQGAWLHRCTLSEPVFPRGPDQVASYMDINYKDFDN